jgi:hypothetical protein
VARSKKEQELFEVLRARGLRKRVARTVSEAASKTNGGRVPKPVRDALGDLQSVVTEVQGRIGGDSKKRSEAAKKAAQTRKRKAAQRSTAAKKAARTRAKAGSR